MAAQTDQAETTNEPSIALWMKDLPPVEDSQEFAPSAQQQQQDRQKEEAAAAAASSSGKSSKESQGSAKTGTERSTAGASPSGDGTAPNAGASSQPAKSGTESKTGTEASDDVEEKFPKTGDDWDRFKTKRREREEKLKAEIKSRETKVAEYDQQLKQLQAELAQTKEITGKVNPEIQAEIDRLKKENEEYSTKLAVSEVTQHPKFIAYFKGKVDEQIALAKNIVGTEMAEEVAKVLIMPDGDFKNSKLEELMSNMTPLQSQRFANRIDALQAIENERQSEISKAQENRAKMIADQQAIGDKRRTDGKKVFSEVLKTLQDPKDGMAVWQMREGDDAWNAQVRQNIAEAEKILFGSSDQKPVDIVKASMNAAAFPQILRAYSNDIKQRDDKIAKLEAQVAELSAAQPSTSGRGSEPVGGEQPAPAKLKQGMNPFEMSAAWARSMSESQ